MWDADGAASERRRGKQGEKGARATRGPGREGTFKAYKKQGAAVVNGVGVSNINGRK